MPDLKAPGGDFNGLIDGIAERLFRKQLQDGEIPDSLYEETANALLKGLFEGMGGETFAYTDPRNSLRAYLEQNLYSFSAAKSLAELEQFRGLFYDADGKRRSFEQFREAVRAAGFQFNGEWLKTEFITFLAGAQGGVQWDNYISEGVTTLEYRTMEDDKVRPAHAALDGFTAAITDAIWNIIFPPNDWRCRCVTLPGIATKIGKVVIDVANIKASIPAMFQKNVGKTREVFGQDHPYFNAVGGSTNDLEAVANYGMQPVERLYEKYRFDPAIEFASKDEAGSWWHDHTKGGGIMVAKDPKGLSVGAEAGFFQEVEKAGGVNMVGNIEDIIKAPDEIWSTRKADDLERVYIKYYREGPVAVIAHDDKGIKATKLVDLRKGKGVDTKAVEKLRRGALILRKT